MKKPRIELCLALCLTSFLSRGATFVVTNTADAGAGSLRQAILNANLSAGADVIQFNVPGSGAHTISPLSALPAVSDPVLIDGRTQPGFAGLPLIELNGTQAGATANGLWITAGNSAVAGLVINRFGNAGILLQNNGTNFIAGNFIGTDQTGSSALGNWIGVLVDGSQANTIGSTDANGRNLLSGNRNRGLYLSNSRANVIIGNFIGTDVKGGHPLGNGSDGLILDSANANTIGGTSAGEGNLIAANAWNGIYMTFASSNVVEGNFIGTDVTGALALGNGLCGVNLNSSPQNTIGGTEAGSRNLISGNHVNGIELSGANTAGNVVQGNLLGTDLTGTKLLGNFAAGVFLGNAPNNLIGTADPGARNVISGNDRGVHLFGSSASGNSVEGNYVGTDLTGTVPLANGVGVRVEQAPANAIGTTDAGNLISGNIQNGIELMGGSSTSNSVEGNLIGTDRAGTRPLGNGGAGIFIADAPLNTIGGTGPASRNVISGNGDSGMVAGGAGATGNVIQGNYFGTDVAGSAGLGNAVSGIWVSGTLGITVGGTEAGAGNVVSGNLSSGIFLNGSGHVVQGNFIGTDASGLKAFPNGSSGIAMGGSDHTIGSEMLAGQNIISGNKQNGVSLIGAGNCTVLGNLIGTDVTGSQPLGNGASGVALAVGSQNNTIGGAGLGERNIISGNGGAGVLLSDPSTSSNAVLGNFIGLSAAGDNAVPNGLSGVAMTNGGQDNSIGGSSAGEGNRIAYNSRGGVLVQDDSTIRNSIRGNSIFSNAGLGIDLRAAGEPGGTVSPNDPLDTDSGPNGMQNYPVLTNVVYSGGLAIVQGYLRSTPSRSFDLDFFSNTRTEPTGFGEGEVYHPLFDSSVDTDANGYGEFTFQISGSFSNQYFTATATDLITGDTSEFSEAKGGLRITSVRTVGSDVLVSFTSASGSNYRLERTSTLGETPIPWTTVTGAASVAGTGGVLTVTDPGAAALATRSYRVRLLP